MGEHEERDDSQQALSALRILCHPFKFCVCVCVHVFKFRVCVCDFFSRVNVTVFFQESKVYLLRVRELVVLYILSIFFPLLLPCKNQRGKEGGKE